MYSRNPLINTHTSTQFFRLNNEILIYFSYTSMIYRYGILLLDLNRLLLSWNKGSKKPIVNCKQCYLVNLKTVIFNCI